MVTILHGDCLAILDTIEDCSIDAVCTDPPYHLQATKKRFSKSNDRKLPDKPHQYQRLARGFMGQQWDGGDIAFRSELWSKVLRVLKPGGHLVAFAASRGYHRMACAIEDSGFEIRDSILNAIDPADPIVMFMESLSDEQLGAFLRCMDDSEFSGLLAWMYGTGFPKSFDVGKAIDKRAGAERQVVGKRDRYRDGIERADGSYDGEFLNLPNGEAIVTAPATDAAAEWTGWASALKPAFEPIVLARKPLSEGSVAANVMRWRTGALNIDACRIEHNGRRNPAKPDGICYRSTGTVYGKHKPSPFDATQGRWPANVVHDGSQAVLDLFPAKTVSGGKTNGGRRPGGFANIGGPTYRDEGGAARFFYCAKATKAERSGSKHPTVKPLALMRWLVRMITPPGGVVLDCFAGSGTTGEAALREGFRAVLIEREAQFVADIRRRIATVGERVDKSKKRAAAKRKDVPVLFPEMRSA